MNNENIKALIELFGNLGASSKEAFLWYIAIDLLKWIIPSAMVFCVCLKIIKSVQCSNFYASKLAEAHDKLERNQWVSHRISEYNAGMVSRRIEELMEDRDQWKSRYEEAAKKLQPSERKFI